MFASDHRGGVSHIAPDGVQRIYAGATLDLAVPLLPNGIALDRDGSFLVAHLSEGEGGLFRLHRDGRLLPVLRQVDGSDLHVTNFVLLDPQDRIWLTVSTRHNPRIKSFRPGVDDGYIVLIDRQGARIVADGLGFANECRIDPSGKWLYINETYSRRLTRFRLAADGALSERETIIEFGPGDFPDGLAFDVEGGLWVTCIVSNRLIRIAADGTPATLIEDSNAEHIRELEIAFQAGTLDRALLDRKAWTTLGHISSIAFAGPRLDMAYLGVLLSDSLPRIPMPVRGVPPVHWEWR
ncbi:MAG: SMP-30/gluconolactonase/LRE family protein [Betaproteobacteria bacterium]|nr:SMP-30/gluconolactonase/LRE family protein [Betaproteobacteria bacterium]